MKVIFVSFILCLCGFASAQDDIAHANKKILVFKPVEFRVQLSDSTKRLINKMVLKAIAKQSQYQLSIGDMKDGIIDNGHMFNVVLLVSSNNNGIEVSGKLVDEKNKIIIKKISKKNVDNLQLIRSVEDVAENLFASKTMVH